MYELYVLAKHRRKHKLADRFSPSIITSCSRAPGRATEEQTKLPTVGGVKHLITHRCLGKGILDIHPVFKITIESVLKKSASLSLHIL
jgi:hypothetical protein